MASQELEKILAAMFEAEFCPDGEKQDRAKLRDALLEESAEKFKIPVHRLKHAVLSGRYREYRRARLANELPGVPPGFRRE